MNGKITVNLVENMSSLRVGVTATINLLSLSRHGRCLTVGVKLLFLLPLIPHFGCDAPFPHAAKRGPRLLKTERVWDDMRGCVKFSSQMILLTALHEQLS